MDFPLQQIQLRRDLTWTRQSVQGCDRWLVRDPLTFDHYLLTATERTIALLVDQCESLEQLLSEYKNRHPFQLVTANGVGQFIQKLCQLGILIDDRRGHASARYKRSEAQKSKARILRFLTPLYMRLPGLDASWLLAKLDPVSKFLFHPAVIACALAVFATLFAFVTSHLDSVAGKFLDNVSFLTPADALLILVVFVAVKVSHEFGHALSCRHFGAECHEIGILFLVLAPCLYCDVTDAWRLRSRWQRMFVGAAGMYIELLISTAAMIIWLNTVPSTLNTLAFNTLIVCSVGSVLVNANPLIRFDGYYMLTDITNIPNLGSQANDALDSSIVTTFAYRDVAKPQLDGSKGFLLSYAIAALVYRIVVIVAICWMMLHLSRRFHLEPIGWSVIAIVLFGAIWRVRHTMRNLYGRIRAGGPRPLRVGLAALAVVAAVSLVTVPYSADVAVIGIVESTETTSIYATQTGHLTWTAALGTAVAKGKRIAIIENFELDLQLCDIVGELETDSLRERHLVDRSTLDPAAAQELSTLRSRLGQLERQLETLKQQQQELVILAPHDGVVTSAPWKTETVDQELRLTGWTGDPMAVANRGCLVQRGELLCQFVTNEGYQAVFYVPDQSIELVNADAPAQVCLAATPSELHRGSVLQVGREAARQIPQSLTNRIPVAEVDGDLRPLEPHYRVAISLPANLNSPNYSGVVHGRVAMPPMSLARRCSRYLARVWRADLQ